MRDVNRLYRFYNELMKIHMENFPDMRFGQLIDNLEQWIRNVKSHDDLFYIEEDTMLSYINEFVESIK